MNPTTSLLLLNVAIAGAHVGFGPVLGVYLKQQGWFWVLSVAIAFIALASCDVLLTIDKNKIHHATAKGGEQDIRSAFWQVTAESARRPLATRGVREQPFRERPEQVVKQPVRSASKPAVQPFRRRACKQPFVYQTHLVWRDPQQMPEGGNGRAPFQPRASSTASEVPPIRDPCCHDGGDGGRKLGPSRRAAPTITPATCLICVS
jgi:hypothetical protein